MLSASMSSPKTCHAMMAVFLLAAAAPVCGNSQSDPAPKPGAPPVEFQRPDPLPDLAWTPIQQLIKFLERPGSGLASGAPEGLEPYLSLEELSMQMLRRLGLDFYGRYPHDPRRWEWLAYALQFQPAYIRGMIDPATGFVGGSLEGLWTFKAGFAPKAKFIDSKAKKAWEARQPQLIAAAQAAADCPPEVRADIEHWDMYWAFTHPRTIDKPSAADIRLWNEQRFTLTRKFLDFAKRYPSYDEDAIKGFTKVMMDEVRKFKPDIYEGFVQELRASPNFIVSTFSGGELELEKIRKQPMELKFTSTDGRQIDFAQLRGKVVLIDYWGTWCPACHHELPWLKEVHAKYKDQGFEIVSVMMEFGSTDKDRRRALADIKKNGLESWIHYVTTRMDPEVLKYGIIGAPTHLLLDKSGRLVEVKLGTWNPAQLEPVVRKHLGLAPEAKPQS